MCTCGMDIATQQATPATHSRPCSAAGEKPSGRSETDAATGCPSPAPARRQAAAMPADGAQYERERQHRQQAEDADADVGLAPAGAVDEILQDGRPDGACRVVAAHADRHRDAAAAREPLRRVRHQRDERGGVPSSPISTPCATLNCHRLAGRAGRDEAGAEAQRADQHRDHHAEAIGQSAHENAADAEADHRQRVGQRRVGARHAEVGLDARQAPRRPSTCRSRRWSSAAARRSAASRHRETRCRVAFRYAWSWRASNLS